MHTRHQQHSTQLDLCNLVDEQKKSMARMTNELREAKQEIVKLQNVKLMQSAQHSFELQRLRASLPDKSTSGSSQIVDRATSFFVSKLNEKYTSSKQQLENAQLDLAASRYTHDSQHGRRLVAKLHQVLQENEQLEKSMSAGMCAKQEISAKLQTKVISELEDTHKEMGLFIQQEHDEQEGYQSHIFALESGIKHLQQIMKACPDCSKKLDLPEENASESETKSMAISDEANGAIAPEVKHKKKHKRASSKDSDSGKTSHKKSKKSSKENSNHIKSKNGLTDSIPL